MSKVLITGGAGTIGYFLCKSLYQQGHDITLIDDLSRGKLDLELKELLQKPNIKLIEFDICDYRNFNQLDSNYDYIYHLAAINGTKNFYEIPEIVLSVGVQGTLNILNWFRNLDMGKILFASSNEVYASWVSLSDGKPIPTPETVPLCIDDVTNPRWSYGGSKLIGELLFMNFSRAYKFPMSIVRYHNSYGPRMGFDHVIPQFLLKILRNEDPFVIFGDKETRAFCYIDDTINATQTIMESKKTNGKIIHIGNDSQEISMMDLALMMFEMFNYHPKIEIHPAPKGSVKRRCPDITKIKTLTDWNPKINLNQGLEITYEWYKKILNERNYT